MALQAMYPLTGNALFMPHMPLRTHPVISIASQHHSPSHSSSAQLSRKRRLSCALECLLPPPIRHCGFQATDAQTDAALTLLALRYPQTHPLWSSHLDMQQDGSHESSTPSSPLYSYDSRHDDIFTDQQSCSSSSSTSARSSKITPSHSLPLYNVVSVTDDNTSCTHIMGSNAHDMRDVLSSNPPLAATPLYLPHMKSSFSATHSVLRESLSSENMVRSHAQVTQPTLQQSTSHENRSTLTTHALPGSHLMLPSSMAPAPRMSLSSVMPSALDTSLLYKPSKVQPFLLRSSAIELLIEQQPCSVQLRSKPEKSYMVRPPPKVRIVGTVPRDQCLLRCVLIDNDTRHEIVSSDMPLLDGHVVDLAQRRFFSAGVVTFSDLRIMVKPTTLHDFNGRLRLRFELLTREEHMRMQHVTKNSMRSDQSPLSCNAPSLTLVKAAPVSLAKTVETSQTMTLYSNYTQMRPDERMAYMGANPKRKKTSLSLFVASSDAPSQSTANVATKAELAKNTAAADTDGQILSSGLTRPT